MILCIGTTPAAQRVMVFRRLTLDAVNRAVTTLDGAAGKSVNVAKVLQVLGEQPLATGFLGGDRGEEIRAALQARGVAMDFVPVSTPTRQCITVIDEAAGTVTELVEEGRPVTAADYEQLLAIIRQRVLACRAVVLSGTLAAGGPPDFYSRCIHLAHQVGAITVADAQRAALLDALQAKPGLVKPNRPELAATVGRELKEEAEVIEAMRQLAHRGAQRVVVTAGHQPTLAFDGQQVWRIQSPRLQAVNPIGSGDAFTAALVWRLVQGENLGEACRWGAAAGAANALTPMAGEVDKAEVEKLVKEVEVEPIG